MTAFTVQALRHFTSSEHLRTTFLRIWEGMGPRACGEVLGAWLSDLSGWVDCMQVKTESETWESHETLEVGEVPRHEGTCGTPFQSI